MPASSCTPKRAICVKSAEISQITAYEDGNQGVTTTGNLAIGSDNSTSGYGFWMSSCIAGHSARLSEITASDIRLQHLPLEVSLAVLPSSSITVAKRRSQGPHLLLTEETMLSEYPQLEPSALGRLNVGADDGGTVEAEPADDAREMPGTVSPLSVGPDSGESFRTTACAEGLLYELHEERRALDSLDGTVRQCQTDDSDIHDGYASMDDFDSAVSSETMTRAIEACDGNMFSKPTFAVASSHPEADLHVPGVCFQMHPDVHDGAWSDIVLTRGQDPCVCVVGSVVIGKSNQMPIGVKEPGQGLSPEETGGQHDADPHAAGGVCQSGAAARYPYIMHDRETKCSAAAGGKSHTDAGKGNKIKTPSSALERVRGSSEGRCSLPARLLHHVCQRVQAYDQYRMNKSHLLIVGSTALIAVTIAVLLICIVHALLGKNPAVAEAPFLS
ncbi:conserved hypothetical protein [Neospora caninum Liverpool]|uniref:Transmembrane protein n=1 Tax=Neospora caninum (strain Liverpool) TaxID=572307 RepID=F0VJN3_NEOCL|nr:conserved hypothetical protein [Neospora caninum Liverpool]CBZ53944.1 conserved hypothetical protein [Neospora caninum Liverpool]CEL67943.1 TPA: hypothetical protein BN1204_037260 [Neospora caninum Liverpool]|eukprot:XP_003883976.1 conserved hypothetical protein [Neospora caninum Liverpool]